MLKLITNELYTKPTDFMYAQRKHMNDMGYYLKSKCDLSLKQWKKVSTLEWAIIDFINFKGTKEDVQDALQTVRRMRLTGAAKSWQTKFIQAVTDTFQYHKELNKGPTFELLQGLNDDTPGMKQIRKNMEDFKNRQKRMAKHRNTKIDSRGRAH